MTQAVRYPINRFVASPQMPDGSRDTATLDEMHRYALRLVAIDADSLIWHASRYVSAERLRDVIVALQAVGADDLPRFKNYTYKFLSDEIAKIGAACVWDGAAAFFIPCIAGEALGVWSEMVIRYRKHSQAAHTYRADRARNRPA